MQNLGAYLIDERERERDRIGHPVNVNKRKQLGARSHIDQPILYSSDYNLDPDSDEYIDEFISTMTRVDYHAAGSCKMGAKGDPTAVVDPLLRSVLHYHIISIFCSDIKGGYNPPPTLKNLIAASCFNEF